MIALTAPGQTPRLNNLPDTVGRTIPFKAVVFVKEKEYKRLLERKQQTQQALLRTQALQRKLDSLWQKEKEIGKVVELLERDGNELQREIEQFGQEVLRHGLSIDRRRDALREQKQEIRENVDIEKKVVRRGEEMTTIERTHRYGDGIIKILLSIFSR